MVRGTQKAYSEILWEKSSDRPFEAALSRGTRPFRHQVKSIAGWKLVLAEVRSRVNSEAKTEGKKVADRIRSYGTGIEDGIDPND